MQSRLQISFNNMAASEAVRTRIEELASRLGRFHDRIVSCRVVVSTPNRSKRKGRLYHVSIGLKLPGSEIAINRSPTEDLAHQDVSVAIRDAFDALTRRLEDVTRQSRGDVKTHEAVPLGRIVRLFSEKHYGILESDEDGEVYFHANSVANSGSGNLAVGGRVQYHAALGEKGLQATMVKLVKSAKRMSVS